MAGYNLILKIREIETRLANLGMMMCYSKHSSYGGTDVVSIKPKDLDSLPVYARDAEFYTGTIEQLEEWVHGVEWARRYDAMVFGQKHNGNRERKEQDHRNAALLITIKNSQKEEAPADRKSTRLNSSHIPLSRMPSSA